MLIVLTLEFDTRDCIEVRIAAGGGIRIHFARSLRRQQRRSFAGPRPAGAGPRLEAQGQGFEDVRRCHDAWSAQVLRVCPFGLSRKTAFADPR
jgi:hypothetical protein